MEIFLIIIIALVSLYLLITFIMFLLISRNTNADGLPMTKKLLKSLEPYKNLIDEGKDWMLDILNNNLFEDIYIKSKDNLKLHSMLIEHKNSKGIIVEIHGYKSTPERDLFASCHEYYKMGYSLLIIDNRTSSKSEGKYVTFGLKESDDVINWIKYLNKRFPKQSIILAGISMGATTVLLTLKKITKTMNIKCAIADSGYVNAYDEVSYCIKKFFHIPSKLFIDTINDWCIRIADFNLKDVNTTLLDNKIKIPVLFVHGLEDSYVPYENSKENYEYYDGPKELLLFENATHGVSYLVDHTRYIKNLKRFISKYKD